MKSIAVAAFSSAMGGPAQAKPKPSTEPVDVLSPRADATVESIGASLLAVPPPSVTASRLEASTLPASASTALLERNARFANAPTSAGVMSAISAIVVGIGG